MGVRQSSRTSSAMIVDSTWMLGSSINPIGMLRRKCGSEVEPMKPRRPFVY
ncbi:hypothetical protein TIFTF001_041789 [Ficus carica]|uniref:Uncharacterized protein n=1 Tax=Ficus carica TaxID=3494 RepID=A0AA87Z9E8_FICCA|nr:hypothetical protein TIFTF001_041789 [Ficus carica]